MEHSASDKLKTALLAVAVAGLLGGLLLAYAIERSDLASITWMIGVIPILAALLIEILRSLARGEVGLDIVAARVEPAGKCTTCFRASNARRRGIG